MINYAIDFKLFRFYVQNQMFSQKESHPKNTAGSHREMLPLQVLHCQLLPSLATVENFQCHVLFLLHCENNA